MRAFLNAPIRKKLTAITMTASIAAMLLVSLAFVFYEQLSYHETLHSELETLAGIVGDNCASALAFEDPEAAHDVLKSLEHHPSIMAAAVYNKDGRLFATYARDGLQWLIPPPSRGEHYEFRGMDARQFHEIRLAGESIGTILLQHDMRELRVVQRNYFLISGVVIIVAGFVSLLVSSRLQKVISDPVRSLARVVEYVSKNEDYEVRVPKHHADELGKLIEGFNGMLEQIQKRDAALSKAQDELERRVIERTDELAGSNAMLNATLESTADGILALDRSGAVVTWNSRFATMWEVPEGILEALDGVRLLQHVTSRVRDPERFLQRVEHLMARVEDGAFDLIDLLDGRMFERYCMPQHIDGRLVGMVINFRDVTASRTAERELRWKSAFLEAQSNASPDGILVADSMGVYLHMNRKFEEMWELPPGLFKSEEPSALVDHVVDMTDDPERHRQRIMELYDRPLETACDELVLKDGRVMERYTSPVTGEDGTRFGRIWSFRDISERRRAEAEREELNMQLLTLSRQAGMSEVATSVLHNVGNVLNSVNTSCGMLSRIVAESRVVSVKRTADLLAEHSDHLGEFIVNDPRGQKLPDFLAKLGAKLESERDQLSDEIMQLEQNIDHIKDIVSVQQSYAKNLGGIREVVSLESLVEDALRMNVDSISRHRIELVKDYEAIAPIALEKHKVLQILVNLIRNARHALTDGGKTAKRLEVRVFRSGGEVAIRIADNGIGISPENLTRVFAYGFTTKSDGHGFGLHSGVLAAQSMGGRLTVESAGLGEGASFTLYLPWPAAGVSS